MSRVIEEKTDELGRKIYVYECYVCGALVNRRKLVANGNVKCFECKYRKPKYTTTSEENLSILRQMYYAGSTYEEIGDAIGTSSNYVYAIIKNLKAKGLLDEKVRNDIRKKISAQKKADKEKSKLVVNDEKPWVQPEGTVFCNSEIQDKCKYGSTNPMYGCNYCDVMHKSRGCSAQACDKFDEGEKEGDETLYEPV